MNTVFIVLGVAFVLCGAAVVVVQLTRGDLGFGQLRGLSPETRRAVRRAIRDGGTDDAEVDHLARQTIRLTPRIRWAKYFFGAMLAQSIVQLAVGPHTAGEMVLRSAQAGLWTSLAVLSIVNQRRLDGYRGLKDRSSLVQAPPSSR